jgi:hypothetical protein
MGDLKAAPPAGEANYEFRPVLGSSPYRQVFAQSVVWTFSLPDGKYGLVAQPFGVGSVPKPFLEVDTGASVILEIGNVPFEGILRTGVGVDDVIDNHFLLYYDLIENPPERKSIPHRVSAQTRDPRTQGGNCPPAILKAD